MLATKLIKGKIMTQPKDLNKEWLSTFTTMSYQEWLEIELIRAKRLINILQEDKN